MLLPERQPAHPSLWGSSCPGPAKPLYTGTPQFIGRTCTESGPQEERAHASCPHPVQAPALMANDMERINPQGLQPPPLGVREELVDFALGEALPPRTFPLRTLCLKARASDSPALPSSTSPLLAQPQTFLDVNACAQPSGYQVNKLRCFQGYFLLLSSWLKQCALAPSWVHSWLSADIRASCWLHC